MKTKHKRTIGFAVIVLFSIFFLCSVAVVNAQAQPYTLLVDTLPLVGQSTTLDVYVPAAFRIAMGVSAVLAFVMITFGGIMYATTDAISGKEDGRRFITNAVIGLLLVIGSYAILYTINPEMLSFNFSRFDAIKIEPALPSAEATPLGAPPCTGCVTFASLGLPAKSGVQYVNAQLGAKLVGINNRVGVPWQITEGYSQSDVHVPTSCHKSGNCVDINVINKRDVGAINELFRQGLALGSFSSVTFEVKTKEEISTLRNGCSTCVPRIPAIDSRINISDNTKATDWHFHVVN